MFMRDDDKLLDVARRESAHLHDHGLFDASIALDLLVNQRAELLEALKDTVCALECCGKDYPAMTKGRAAISKAEAAE